MDCPKCGRAMREEDRYDEVPTDSDTYIDEYILYVCKRCLLTYDSRKLNRSR